MSRAAGAPPDPGLRFDVGPPMGVTVGWLLLVPIAMAVGGVLLVSGGGAALAHPGDPRTIALTHVGTLGVLGSAMLGALYQLVPVLGGGWIRRPRLAHAVMAVWALGVAGLVAGLLGMGRVALLGGAVAIGVALLGWLAQLVPALAAPSRPDPSLRGLRLAVAHLVAVASLGIWMAARLALGLPGPDRATAITAHLSLALLGWVGVLMASVAWKVLPMFWIAERPSAREQDAILGLAAVGGVGALVGLAIGTPVAVQVGAIPAVVAAWIAHPALGLVLLARRRRARVDGGLRFWQLALGTGLLCAPVAVVAVVTGDTRWALLLVWLAVWGHAGAAVHGMAGRIVPFLVWLHRFSQTMRHGGGVAMRDLLPDRSVRVGLALHASATVSGAAAILTQADALARLTGALALATGLVLGAQTGGILWRGERARRSRGA